MRLAKRLLLVLIIVLGVAVYLNYPKLNIISGYASKNMASTVFITNRNAESVTKNDNDVPLINLAAVETDGEGAEAAVFGLMERKSICHEGLGCVLVNENYDPNTSFPKPHRNQAKNDLPFPYGENGIKDSVFADVDYEALYKAMDDAFSNPEIQKTRTVLVAYKNQIIGEKYLDGFTKDTPILGWSMTKSVLATLYGILEYQGKINLNKPAPISDWQNDEREEITLNHLLRMQSGLAWDEDYTSISDVNKMLFLDADMSKGQVEKEAIAPPTEIWNYSSGTSNLLSGVLRNQFSTHQEYIDFPYKALIDKIGMHSMLIEIDMKGNFVGSSYAWANTRDWAKFGLLYLNNGNWNGEQLFDFQWVDYVSKPTLHSDGTYGGHFWLNANGKFPDVPRDMYSANGYQGQRVFIIPSKDLVVVRTGLAEEPDFNINNFLKKIIEPEINLHNGRLDKLQSVQAFRKKSLERQLEELLLLADSLSKAQQTSTEPIELLAIQHGLDNTRVRIGKIRLELSTLSLLNASDLYIDTTQIVQEPRVVYSSKWTRPLVFGVAGLAIGLVLIVFIVITSIIRTIINKRMHEEDSE